MKNNLLNRATATGYLNRLQIVFGASALCVLAFFYAGYKADNAADKTLMYGSATVLGMGITKTVHGITSDIHKRLRTCDSLDTQVAVQQIWDSRNDEEDVELLPVQSTNRYPLAPDQLDLIDEGILNGRSKTAILTDLNGGKRPNGNKYSDWCQVYEQRKVHLLNGSKP